MEDRRRREIALFRYSIVRDCSDARLSHKERGRLVRSLAEQDHSGPDGEPVRLGRSTIDRWIRAYRAGGFDALVPVPRRADPRTPPALLELAETLKAELPERTAAQLARIIEASGRAAPSTRTIQRHYARLGLVGLVARTPVRVFGRYEASAPNELWLGDGLHGPVVAGHKSYLLAFLDDFSRALVGYRWTHAEDTVRLEAALRSGLASRGLPQSILVDRGSAYVSPELARACAVLGIRLVHAKPRSPETKGKIERLFRTMRIQWLVEFEARGGIGDLAEMNTLFEAWVEVVYHQTPHSETKATPLKRLLSAGPAVLPSPEQLHEAFLWSSSRLVSKTAQVSLFGNSFEVDAALVGQSVELIYDPFDLCEIEVRFRGRPMGKAVPVRISRHVHPKARLAPAPARTPSGIDYLAIIARRRESELLGRRIDYSGLAQTARPDAAAAVENDDGGSDDEEEQ
jgi:putative transposase